MSAKISLFGTILLSSMAMACGGSDSTGGGGAGGKSTSSTHSTNSNGGGSTQTEGNGTSTSTNGNGGSSSQGGGSGTSSANGGGNASGGNSGSGGGGIGGQVGAGGANGAGGGVGTGGGANCPVETQDCGVCVAQKCMTQDLACNMDSACAPAEMKLVPCVCKAQQGMGNTTINGCFNTFETAGGADADAVETCVIANCGTPCSLN